MANFVERGSTIVSMETYSQTDLAYAAGIVDGEGYIGITEIKPRYEPSDRNQRRKSPGIVAQVAVVMADAVIPVWLSETFGGTFHSYPPRKPGHRGSTHWRLQGPRAAEFCGLIAEYLRLKGPQARLVIDYYADSRFVFKQRQTIPLEEIEARREYVHRAKALNRGGQ